jgi:hypothetical protein
MRGGWVPAVLAALMVGACGGDGTTFEVRSLPDTSDGPKVPMQGLWLSVGDVQQRTNDSGKATFKGLTGSVKVCDHGTGDRPTPAPHSCVTVRAEGRVDLRFSDIGLTE